MALKEYGKKNTTFALILPTCFGKSLIFQALLQVRSTTHDIVSCKQHFELDLVSKHGRKSLHPQTKKPHVCRFSDPSISEKT